MGNIQNKVDNINWNNEFIESVKKINNTKEKFLKFPQARILVCLKNKKDYEKIAKALERIESKVYSSTNIKTTEKHLELMRFDLILVDTTSKNTNGFKIADLIRKSKFNKKTGIIFITKNYNEENKTKYYMAHSAGHIENTLNEDEIFDVIHNFLSQKKLENELIKEKENFIQTLTHDLKTPISAQICACKLLFKDSFGEMSEIKKEITRELFASNKYMLLMIQNILTKYKYDNNSMKLNKKIRNLSTEIQKVINDLKYIFENKKLNVIFEPIENCEFAFDEIEIKRVLNNLFTNAIEHSEENSTIKAILSEKNGEIYFKISNESKNFSEENLKNIFKKFETDITKSGKIGFGLGLFICKEIIEAHNGKIRAYTKKNKDNSKEKIVFEFALPKIMETKQELPF